MRAGSSLGFALFCWVFGEVAASSPWRLPGGDAELWGYSGAVGQPRASPWAWVDVSQLRAAAPLHPVAVQCQEARVVVTVRRDLFGTGRLARAVELTLGSAACLPLAQGSADTAVTFVAGLHECGSTLEVRLGPEGGGLRLGVLRLARAVVYLGLGKRSKAFPSGWTPQSAF